MKKTTIFTIALLALGLCSSCDKNKFEVVPPDELGMPEHEYYVGNAGGNVNIQFLTNKPGTVSLMNENDGSWLKFGTSSFEGADGSIPVQVSANEGFKRRADILFLTDTRKDTVSVFQNGSIDEIFYISAESILVMNGTGEVNSIAAEINIPLDRIKTEVRYSGGEEWIKNCQLSSSALTFSTSDNADKKYSRQANIFLSFKDG